MNAQARLGAFVLVGLIVLGLLSVRIGRIHMFGNDGAIVEAIFSDVSGLQEQTPVRMAGVKIGSVASITLENNRALVRMHLKPDIVLPASTRASLAGGGLMGEKFIALNADPNDTKPLPPGKRIPTFPSGNLDVLIAKAGFIADDIHQLTTIGKHAINTLATVLDENRSDLHNTIHNLSDVSDSMKKKLPGTLADVQHAFKRLPKAVDASENFFKEGRKSFHELDGLLVGNRENIYRMIFEFRKTAENFEALSDDLRRNPWKLMNKQKEVPPSPRARRAKMEEMMLSTGQMGLAPARR
ncbi:MAG: MlaD family protein [Mariprofundaceae bacterium]|nr:MlaD family protein [Mariprofundaceae bacterium]